MLRIGLSGGIGAGKSTVSSTFAAEGGIVVDGDVIAREVVEPGTEGLAALVAASFASLPLQWSAFFTPEALAAFTDAHPGALALPLLFVATFAAPTGWSTGAAGLWVMGFFLLASLAYSCFQVPYLALPAELTEDAAAADRDVAEVEEELRQHVGKDIGPIAKPKRVLVVPELPKTRSGKIMRRLLKDVAEGRDPGDSTTLADPTVMQRIVETLAPKA